MMMTCSYRWPTALLSILVGCAVAPSESPGESTTSSEVVSVNRIIGNRLELSRIALHRLAVSRLSAGRMTVAPQAASLLDDEEGREVLSLVVSCALPTGITLVGTVNGTVFDFPGEVGLAPQWAAGRLDTTGQRWVSACMFARVNAQEVVIPISMRGPHRGLETDADERAAWTLEEGAFFGNIFIRPDQPLQAFACRGRDKAAGDTGELADRQCAAPDPANPGFTLCGMVFAGDCGNFAPDRACETFSADGTFYGGCHTSPIRHHRDHGRESDRDDRDDRDAQVFEQVITTFATP